MTDLIANLRHIAKIHEGRVGHECILQAADVIAGLENTYQTVGWWHRNVKDGQVHDHPEHPSGSWSYAGHRQCEPIFTQVQT